MRITVNVGGKEYPCRQTMGAMLRFKRETGKEVTEITDSVTDMLAYMYCCVKSECGNEGVEFAMSLEQFADRLTLEDVTAWASKIGTQTQDAPGDEKKTGA